MVPAGEIVMAAERLVANENDNTILTFTLADGHKVAVRARDLRSVAGMQPQVNENLDTYGPTWLYTLMTRYNIKESVDEVLAVWCHQGDGE